MQELESLDEDELFLWTCAYRVLEAEERLNFHTDINAGFFADNWKMLRLHLAELAYGDQPEVYQKFVYSLSATKSPVQQD